MTCQIECSGFRVLRSECQANPCLGDNMCYNYDPSIPLSVPCEKWCCVSRSGMISFMTLLACFGTFLLLVSWYLRRLHQINVATGAVQPNPEEHHAASRKSALENARTAFKNVFAEKGERTGGGGKDAATTSTSLSRGPSSGRPRLATAQRL